MTALAMLGQQTNPWNAQLPMELWATIVLISLCSRAYPPFGAVSASDVDNGVLGSPTVECGRDSVHFKVATKKPFGGRVYVKGEFGNPTCVNSVVMPDEKKKDGSRDRAGDGHEGDDEKDQFRSTGGDDADRNQFGTAGNQKGSGTGRKDHKKEDHHHHHDDDDEGMKKKKQWTAGGRGGGGVPEGEDEEEGSERTAGGIPAEEEEGEGELDDETIRQVLQELQKRRNSNTDGSQRPIPSHLPGFGSAEQLKRWRSFLRGKPGLDGQGFRRYGSRLSPDANGECPLVCPPCEECNETSNGKGRQRRLAEEGHSAELKIPLGECNTRRDRTANPPGMQVTFTVVVSFHPSFITRVDRAYNIQCAYQEPERLLSTQIDVSPPPIININNQMESPQCEYRIHGQSSSDQVRNVRVGEMVEHEWACHGTGKWVASQKDHREGEADEEERGRMAELYGLLVHDCFVDDGKSRKVQVVDSRGCSTDLQILPTPVYSSDSLRASILSPVAKFPDGDLVGFQCSITVCMRDLGKCDGITPPNCASSPQTFGKAQKGEHIEDLFEAYSTDNRTKRFANEEEWREEEHSMDWQLNSPLMTVFDLVEGTEETEGQPLATDGSGNVPTSLRHTSASHHHSRLLRLSSDHPPSSALLLPQMCLSLPLFTVLISASTFLVTVSAGTLLSVMLFRGIPLKTKH